MKTQIKIEAAIKKDIKTVWIMYTLPEHIIHWNTADESWHTTRVENDFSENGRFNYRMEAKDQSMGFDYCGTYTKIKEDKEILYVLDDERTVDVRFFPENGKTLMTIKFEAEEENSVELQRNGWQKILNNFKQYCEEGNI